MLLSIVALKYEKTKIVGKVQKTVLYKSQPYWAVPRSYKNTGRQLYQRQSWTETSEDTFHTQITNHNFEFDNISGLHNKRLNKICMIEVLPDAEISQWSLRTTLLRLILPYRTSNGLC